MPGGKKAGAITMKTATALAGALAKAFDPPPSGFVGIVDNLLQLCRGGELELAWQSNACHVQIRQGSVEEILDLPLRKAVLRAMLARIAGLCNERQPGSVSPYGGRGEISLGPEAQAVFSVHFVNTAAQQSLKLAHQSHDGTNAADQVVNSGDVGSSAETRPLQ
jgi:hypothetical protein